MAKQTDAAADGHMPSKREQWQTRASALLTGRRIVAVRWMSDEEANDFGWTQRPLVMTLDNGVELFAQSDDEGNDAGALCLLQPGFKTSGRYAILPTFVMGWEG